MGANHNSSATYIGQKLTKPERNTGFQSQSGRWQHPVSETDKQLNDPNMKRGKSKPWKERTFAVRVPDEELVSRTPRGLLEITRPAAWGKVGAGLEQTFPKRSYTRTKGHVKVAAPQMHMVFKGHT